MIRTSVVSDITVGSPWTWEKCAFITFDIDWAPDAVIEDSINLLVSAGVRATWYATHPTPLLKVINDNPLFELGIHPNFNKLLGGQAPHGESAWSIVEDLCNVVPEATSARSHSIVQGGPVSLIFEQHGITHESNCNIPESAGVRLRPWTTSNGLTSVPYCWADEHSWTQKQSNKYIDIIDRVGLAVFDFHPIHVFLNTDSAKFFQEARQYYHQPHELLRRRTNSKCGARTMLCDLLEAIC